MWTYIQSTGELVDPQGQELGKGYSGAPGYVNDAADQDLANRGPIPRGLYLLGFPYDDPESGPYTMRLTPDPNPLPDGRSGFKMHGDSLAHPGCGSLGCICMPYDLRLRVGSSGDTKLRVIATAGDLQSQPDIPPAPAGGNA